MLRQERTEDQQEALRLAILGFQSELWTALPGIVESVDFAKNTCVVQPAIQGVFRQKDGTTKKVTMPLCLDVPISWPTGGGLTLTFPLKKGDEGQLIFNSRCIDAWWQNGDVQPQAEFRFHDLSDACFYAGIRSQPRKLAAVSQTAAELRIDDGTVKVSLSPDEMDVQVTTDVTAKFTKTTIDLKVKANSALHMEDGKIALTATEIKLNGLVWDTHEHTGVTAGAAKTGGPTAP